jgi:hypothetical protein
MTYDEMVSKVADSVGLSKKLVDRTYKAYWKAVREYVTALPLKKDLTDEEFMALRPNVNIPSIGKLYITLDKYKRIKKQHLIIQELTEKKYAKNKGN